MTIAYIWTMDTKRLGEHLEKLAYFKMVADLKSVLKASSRLGISQPAVSRSIKVLESVLDCKLMERESRGIRLTRAGESLYQFAAHLEKVIKNFEFKKDSMLPAKPLRVATYDNIAINIFSLFASELLTSVPQLTISVGGPNSRILGDVISGKVDCAFIAQPRILPGLTYQKIWTERYGLFVSCELWNRSGLSKKNLRGDDLKSHRLIAMPDAIAGANRNIDRLLWETGLKAPLAIDSYEVALRLVLDHCGIGILPFSTTWRSLNDGLVKEINIQETRRAVFGEHDLTLCWNKSLNHPGVGLIGNRLLKFYRRIKNPLGNR